MSLSFPDFTSIRNSLAGASKSNHRRDRSGPQPEHTWLSILNSFRDPVALFDRNLRHVYVNEATALATNIPSERFRGKTMRDLGHPPEICEQIDRNLKIVFATGEQRDVNIVFEGPSGTVTYECRMRPEFGEEDLFQYVIVVSRAMTRFKGNDAGLF